MDRNEKSDIKESLTGVESEKGTFNGEDDESQLLLSKGGGLSKESGKPRRKVQWIDKNGDKLAEVMEYQPSDESDSDEEESEACFCRIM